MLGRIPKEISGMIPGVTSRVLPGEDLASIFRGIHGVISGAISLIIL